MRVHPRDSKPEGRQRFAFGAQGFDGVEVGAELEPGSPHQYGFGRSAAMNSSNELAT
jgi:hypothetical protein